ncbi:hypothetical protein MMC31_001292 [Peltigera leucophlebia]|nr:hypothetical protein [Peltigera leucophlebia]
MQRPSTSSQKPPGSTPSLKIVLKSLRNPPLTLSLSSESPLTSIHELKAAVVKELGGSAKVENIRILYKKKPCSDSKTVKEIVGDEGVGKEVEFTVMVIGGFAAPVSQQGANPGPVSQGPSGEEILRSEEFWGDLKGFLLQRLRDEEKATEALNAFQKGWRKREAL